MRSTAGMMADRCRRRCCGRPPDALVERAAMTRFMRERGFDDYDDAVALVGRRPRRLLGVDLGLLRASASAAARCSPSREMPGAQWFPGAHAQLRRARVPRQGRRRARRSSPAARAASDAELDLGRAARTRRARIAAGLRALGVERGDRVVAYMPNIPESDRRVPGLRVARRGLVELLARLRRAQRDRPLRADRAEGAAGRRRLPLQRPRRSTAATRSAPIARRRCRASGTPCCCATWTARRARGRDRWTS